MEKNTCGIARFPCGSTAFLSYKTRYLGSGGLDSGIRTPTIQSCTKKTENNFVFSAFVYGSGIGMDLCGDEMGMGTEL